MSNAARLSALYGGMFLVIGIMMPFWPVWLDAKGLSAAEIGLVFAAGSTVRVLTGPLAARIADRTGERKRPIIFMTISAFVLFLPFAIADSFWTIFIIQACLFGALGPLMPMSESLTMLGAKSHGLDYGRIRLWGSVAFIVGASGVGFFLKGGTPDMIWTAVLMAISFYVLASFFIPDFRSTPGGKDLAPVSRVLSDKTFLLFIAATVCIQGSHAFYYTFGTLNWLRIGLGEGVIGLLWAEGVVAEVILFVFAAGTIRKLGPARLIALGGLACLLRWPLMAITDDVWLIALLQLLHAFSFGASHLGAIYFIAERMPDEVSATAQTLYALIVSGLGIGLTSWAAGHLYEVYTGDAFFIMGVMGGVGMLFAWALRRPR